MTRLIINGQSLTSKVDDIQFQLSKLNQVTGTGIATMAATAVGTAGIRQLASKDDHRHPVNMAPASLIAPISLTTTTAGVSDYFPRGDHGHQLSVALSTAVSNVSWLTSTAGVSTTLARQDHRHLLNVGVMTSPARSPETLYTNNGTGPMWVIISHSIGTAGFTSTLDVAGVKVAEIGPVVSRPMQIVGIVNPGSSYYFSSSASNITIQNWVEYGL